MSRLAELRTRLVQIDAWLASGARSVTLDGVTIQIDPEQLRLERQRIENQLPEKRRQRKGQAFRVTGLGG